VAEFFGPVQAPAGYTPELTLGPAKDVSYIVLVCDEPVYVKLWKPAPLMQGEPIEEGIERYIPATQIEGIQITNVCGIAVRSATAALANVQAELAYKHDPQLTIPANFAPVVSVPVGSWSQSFSLSNIATLQPIFSQLIPGGTLGPTSGLRIEAIAEYFNSTGFTHTMRLQISYGGNVFFDANTGIVGSSVNPRSWYLDAVLANLGATNAQGLGGMFSVSTANLPSPGPGFGDLSTADAIEGTLGGFANIDSTVAQTLTVAYALNTASLGITATGNVQVSLIA
jgi:hypothetical protein